MSLLKQATASTTNERMLTISQANESLLNFQMLTIVKGGHTIYSLLLLLNQLNANILNQLIPRV